jgi:hypothetical protein
MTTPTTAQRQAREENNVIRNMEGLKKSLRLAGFADDVQVYDAIGLLHRAVWTLIRARRARRKTEK